MTGSLSLNITDKATTSPQLSMSTVVIGATGLCGNFIVKHAPEYYSHIYTISRSQPDFTNGITKVTAIFDSDSSNWSQKVKEIKEQDSQCTTFFSGLGTTRAKAGGIANQRKIDLDLNLELAKAAKEAGFSKYVLISSGAASASSRFPYMKMKGELEDAVIALGFDETIILRPGVLLGERKEDKGFLNNLVVKVAGLFHDTRFAKYVFSPIYGEEVAIAALKTAQKTHDKKVTIIEGVDINALAKA